MEDFGIIVATYEKDYCFAKGCCASIRHFLGDVPICLIVDGSFSVEDLEKTYQVQVLYRSQAVNDCLRDKKWKSSTKMLAFWESPWEYFLYLDADMVVWGDLLKWADFTDLDMIIDRPKRNFSDESICEWMFNGPKIEKYFPDFNWRNRPYFCTGVYFAKRGIFDLDEYRELLDLRLSEPNLFYGMDQGILNLMIFRAADRGQIRLGQEPMQIIVSNFSLEELKERFPVANNDVAVQQEEASAIHWSGKKPFISRFNVYPEPMNFFRRKFLRDAENLTGLPAELALQIEDFKHYKNKLWRRLTGKGTTAMAKPVNF